MAYALVLLSGGLDSYTTAALAMRQGFELYALTIFYHQRHHVEVEAAGKIACKLKVKKHLVLNLDILKAIGNSALTDAIAVPENRTDEQISAEIPVTYVPARNTIFLSYALAWAEVIGARDIFIGVNAVDYSGYPDCRPEFIEAFERMANLGTKAGVSNKPFTIRTPLIHLTKCEIIRQGYSAGCDYSLTVSCYQPDGAGRACGKCDSCCLRKKGFLEACIPDPTIYQK